MRLAASLLVLTVLSASVSVAAETPASGQQLQAKPKKPEKTCRVPKVKTGSRMGVAKVCKTAEQWAEYDAKNSDKANEAASALGNMSRTNR